jgi:hypothetical protein
MTIKEILSKKSTRIEACRKSKYLFFLYYFTDYFTFPSADFHKDWAKDFEFNEHKYFINLGFRESAKTTYTKLNIIHEIAYKRKNFIMWISYDQKKAEANLFDVALELQENKKLINDFGKLFRADTTEKNKVEKKSIKEFVTTNEIKVLSFGTKGSLRGVVFGKHRPDLLVFDDIENNETKESSAKTRTIIKFIDETLPGLSNHANVILNCNYISEFGVVRYLLDKAEKSGNWKVSWVNVERNGIPTWHQKYVMTNEEAIKRNAEIEDKRFYVTSLEEKRLELGDRVYDQEMMNVPIVNGERFFDIGAVDQRIQYLKDNDVPSRKLGEWIRWGDYDKSSRYGIGADVSQGVRADSAVIQIYDFTHDKQIGEFVSDTTDPRQLGEEMVKAGMEFGHCILCPENNSIGGETIRQIQELNYENIYANVTTDKINNKYTNSWGWSTNARTKSEMLLNFRDQFEKGLIEINSLPLLYEMRAFTRTDLKVINIYDSEISQHFDRVMAMAITLMMREYSEKSMDEGMTYDEYVKSIRMENSLRS